MFAVCLLVSIGASGQCFEEFVDRPAFVEEARSKLDSLSSELQFTTDDPPWLLMHALLGFGPDTLITCAASDNEVRLIEYVLRQGEYGETDVVPFFVTIGGKLNPASVRGLPYFGQAHRGQYVYILSEWNVAPDTVIRAVDGGSATIREVLCNELLFTHNFTSAQWLIPPMADYLPNDSQFANRFGQLVTIEGIMERVMDRPDLHGHCGGAHRLCALAKYLAKVGDRRSGPGVLGEQVREVLDAEWLRVTTACTPLASDGDKRGDARLEVTHASGIKAVSDVAHKLEWMLSDIGRTENFEIVDKYVELLIVELQNLENEVGKQSNSDVGALCHAAHALNMYVELR
jgi:hypothetical protein